MVTVRCPSDLDPWMQTAGGLERRRIRPLVRNLPRETNSQFRRVWLDLDEG